MSVPQVIAAGRAALNRRSHSGGDYGHRSFGQVTPPRDFRMSPAAFRCRPCWPAAPMSCTVHLRFGHRSRAPPGTSHAVRSHVIPFPKMSEIRLGRTREEPSHDLRSRCPERPLDPPTASSRDFVEHLHIPTHQESQASGLVPCRRSSTAPHRVQTGELDG